MEVVQACRQEKIEDVKDQVWKGDETAPHCGNSGGVVEPLFKLVISKRPSLFISRFSLLTQTLASVALLKMRSF